MSGFGPYPQNHIKKIKFNADDHLISMLDGHFSREVNDGLAMAARMYYVSRVLWSEPEQVCREAKCRIRN